MDNSPLVSLLSEISDILIRWRRRGNFDLLHSFSIDFALEIAISMPYIAKKTGATVIGIVETINDLAAKGCEKTVGCNIGGKVKLDSIELVFTQAFHSMSSNPSGVLIFLNDKTIYHAGDTGVFGDMKLIGELYPIDLAFVPVGGHFTMGPEEASKAIQLLQPKTVVPIHYNTFDLIKQNINQNLIKDSKTQLVILEPGQDFVL